MRKINANRNGENAHIPFANSIIQEVPKLQIFSQIDNEI
jgi:hypothetical protein